MSEQPRPKSLLRRLIKLCLWGVLAVGLFIGVAEGWVTLLSHGRCHDSAAECSPNSVGLVLGCSKYVRRGYNNYFYVNRMKTAADLWRSGKVRCLIVSGDNRAMNYNEPRDMKNSLIQLGVPADRIVCDFAGICTYDSVVRAHRIFGADKLVIVSQEPHAERAVAIARQLDIEAEGLNAPSFAMKRSALIRFYLRERAARISMVYDILTNRTPHHMGTPVKLPH